MFNLGYEFKNKTGEVLATVVGRIERGISHGFVTMDECKYYQPLYVCKRKAKNGGETIVTVTEAVLAGKERWTELDKVREK